MIRSLKPIFKWTGGKRREIKNFETFFPDFVKRKTNFNYIEPFVGAGAVFFHLNNENGFNVINDYDFLLINFYKQYCLNDKIFISVLQKIEKDHEHLSDIYYKYRNLDKNDGLKNLSEQELAIRFFVVNQLAFSGMRRFNDKGEFNIPFGHYKKLNTKNINSEKHISLLRKTKILNCDFQRVMLNYDENNTFMFLDPPYTRIFKKYSSENNFNEDDHERLADTFKRINKAKLMMIIDKSDFTEKLYKDYIKSSYSLKYGVNIKNRFNTDVQHLIITNY